MHFAVSFSLKNSIDINEDKIRLAPWLKGYKIAEGKMPAAIVLKYEFKKRHTLITATYPPTRRSTSVSEEEPVLSVTFAPR